ncbi:PLDc N-terminal domain-containing protein [Algoriphagus winogradskyi]|uniref:Phospholipase_D-nuclease N-terminal n=1 Tax=Algoriphagus winogradskyi TaxID=237017 RepID=A0ABY1NNP9_9BACT|nr:PLDc N-terminal domain-containing protein [Algoriphagus winogradskyi]SMP12305.1 Phospholipase_D-nuclease N-terminal [Algoriphagus winogradskyi]
MDLIVPGDGQLIWQISFLFSVLFLGFWAYALFDALGAEFRAAHSKLMWVVTIILAPVIGTFLYLAMARSQRKERRRFKPTFSKSPNSN